MGPGRPLVSPKLLGRDQERATLLDLLSHARQGTGQVVLVAGEAGIGKSRLVSEVRDQMERQGMLVIAGACFEPDRILPLAPVRDLLRSALASDRISSDLIGSELLTILPEQDARRPTDGGIDSSPDVGRLVQALTTLYTRIVADRPLLTIVEDLHWSDEASLDVLRRLARRIGRMPVALVLTYRDEEASGALEHFLADLARDRVATRLGLGPLDRYALTAMLAAIFELDRPPQAEFLDTLATLTDSNPFFIEEVVAALVASGDIVPASGGWARKPLSALRIPATIQDAVHRSTLELSPAARAMLELAAVAGRRFDFTLLQAVTGLEEDETLRVVKELVTARLVVEASPDAFIFRHALIREAVYSSLLSRERAILHRRIGEALEEIHMSALDACLEDLAYHSAEAGAWERVLAYAPRAGDLARALEAPRAAVVQYDRAITAMARLGRPPEPALLRGRGQALATSGDFDGALADFTASLEQAKHFGDEHGEWQALLDLGFHWTERDYAEAHSFLSAALEHARAMGDPLTLAHSLNRMGNWFANQEEPAAAGRCHEEALAIFTRLADEAGQAETHDLLAMTAALGGDFIRAHAHGREAAERFRALGDRRGLVGSLFMEAMPAISEAAIAVSPTDLPSALPRLREALTIAHDITWRAGESYTLAILGVCLAEAGEFDPALEALREALAIAEEIEHRNWIVQASFSYGATHRALHELEAARAAYARADVIGREMHSPTWTNMAGGALASTLIALGDLAGAEAILSERLGPETPIATSGQQLLWFARAELALTAGDADSALVIVQRIYAAAFHLRHERDIPPVAELKARIMAALGRPEEGASLAAAASETAGASGFAITRLRLQATLARVLHQAGNESAAARASAVAHALIDRFAGSLADPSRRDRFVAAAASHLPPSAHTIARRAESAATSELTPREREVANLVTSGKTNREIAGELFVSERTIEAHVGNILQKLGFSSRTQIAAWIVKHESANEGA